MARHGRLWQYDDVLNLTAFEHLSLLRSDELPSNVILFINGLNEDLLGVGYPSQMAELLWRKKTDLTVIEIRTRSSSDGWKNGSVARDADDIEKAVNFFKSAEGGARKTILLCGHSTGCNDILFYLSQPHRAQKVRAAVLQAAVSDREALAMQCADLPALVVEAQMLQNENDASFFLPSKFPTCSGPSQPSIPVTVSRWLSLASRGGFEDFFSSDLSDDELSKIFGKIERPIGVFLSGNDEYTPESVDKQHLLERWQKASNGNIKIAKIIQNVSHDGHGPGCAELVFEICSFLIGFLVASQNVE